jgi:DNA-binding NarL/FixJ family response regulator
MSSVFPHPTGPARLGKKMWKPTSTELVTPATRLPVMRAGDMKAILRVMRPLDGTIADPVLRRRRLVADLCRLVGMSVGAELAPVNSRSAKPFHATSDLPPRLGQTLELLLNGASEKQVANQLKLSRHTVHGYVKALYRLYGISSRAELLARHLKR